MKDENEIISISEAARRLGVLRQTLSDIIRVHNLPTKDMPVNPKARGLDRATVKRLRKILNLAAVSA